MGQLVAGQVVSVLFPFSDMSSAKKRPALVLARLPGEDSILCQITTKSHHPGEAIALDSQDFVTGGLPLKSFIRPTRIFTGSEKLVDKVLGTITETKRSEAIDVIVKLLRPPIQIEDETDQPTAP